MSDREAARLLNSAIATLERAVVPELARDESRIALDLVIRVLNMLSVRFSTQEQGLEKLLASTRGLLDDMEPGAQATPAPAAVAPQETSLQKLEHERQHVDAALAVLIPKLVAQAAEPGATANEARQTLQRVIDDQRDYLAQQDPDILNGSAVVYRGGRIDRQSRPEARQKAIDEAALSEYLRKKFPEDTGVAASDVKVITGGFSKTTVLFTKHAAGQPTERLVMRKDLPVPFMNKSIHNEFPLIRKLHAAGMRVAEPGWLETDASIFDGSFLVSNCVAGSTNMQQWRSGPEDEKQVARGLAEVLAQLHTLDLGRLGYGAEVTAKSAGEAIADEIDSWDRLYAQWRTRHYPLIDIPLSWVKQNIPRHLFDQPARVVHGDVGFHNLMVDNGRITALLDWEFSHFGDPVEDLAYARPFLEQIAAWDEFLAHYRACGGADYSAECERFYQVWSLTRNPIGTLDALSIFQNSLPDEIKLAVAGYIFSPYLQLDGSALVMKILAAGNPEKEH